MKTQKKIHPEKVDDIVVKVPKKKSSPEKEESQAPKKKSSPERAKLVVKDYAETSVNESISKMQRQIKKLESSIKDHDSELEDKRSKLEEYKEELTRLELIRNFIPSVHV
jgi:flagellar biosynthesis chaperone FliJ